MAVWRRCRQRKDYPGDCWRAYEKRNVQNAIRSLMKKMNIEIAELEEQNLYLQKHCHKIETQKVVCYCMACLDGIKRGGRQAVHLLELLFPE